MPISSFKFSISTPCLNYGQTPEDSLGQITDEYTYTSDDGCDTEDTNYLESAGFKISQGILESDNAISPIFDGRYQRNDIANYNAKKQRQKNQLKLFQKPVIKWNLECESSGSPNYLTRKEVYEMIFEKKLNTQSDNLGSTMFYGPLFVSILAGIMLLMSLIVACQSFCRFKDCG